MKKLSAHFLYLKEVQKKQLNRLRFYSKYQLSTSVVHKLLNVGQNYFFNIHTLNFPEHILIIMIKLRLKQLYNK